jgi:hypothetical protein
MSFASIANTIDTYLWFFIAALLIGVITGWFASTTNSDGA